MKKKRIHRYADRRWCLCGHRAADHTGIYPLIETRDACMALTNERMVEWCQCRTFQLDNLEYIEQLAEERKLI